MSIKLVTTTKPLKFDKCWMDVGCYLCIKKVVNIIMQQLGLQRLMKSYGDIIMFYYHVQCNELTLK
jgi:hypothetical protein